MYQLLAQGMVVAGQEDEGNAFTSGIDPEMFIRFLGTPERIVLEFTSEMSSPSMATKWPKEPPRPMRSS